MDKKEKKVERSAIKGKAVKERSSAWDELNGKVHDKKVKVKAKTKEGDEDEWEDEEMQVEDEIQNPATPIPVIHSSEHVQPTANHLDSEDEIL